MTDIFAHVINRIDLLEGVVRLELGVMVPGAPEPIVEPRNIVHLPLNGFLRSAATIEGFLKELAKAGLVRAATDAPVEPAAAATTASPNFA
ncbi:MAG TPA: hypothetical protein VK558_08845 [Patescibacteria group bacterium]|nr:hypothetical protein [Patescibacteria group bacterium]